jgi:membrane-associated protein
MEFLSHCVDFVIHLDHHLSVIVDYYGAITYLILFLIIFCETGLVVTPFLPGDSLLFVVGALAAQGTLSIFWIMVLLSAAAILGNISNYFIGRLLAPQVFGKKRIKFIKLEYLERTQRFYEKHGGKTLIITRFLPVFRTFAPFLAGVGHMPYRRFLLYNFIGGLSWINLFIWAGYFFGNLPFVEKNFSYVILVIIVLSLIPAAVEFFRARAKKS